MRTHPPAFADRVVILHAHRERGRDAGEGEQGADQGAVAQATSVSARIEASSALASSRRHAGLALGGAVPRAPDGGGGFCGTTGR